jgi:AcrR family transcriptional regulator
MSLNPVLSAADVPARRGRPRSERADRAIIEAALELFAQSGADGLSIEMVAAKAGVGKATIYRRWPGKEELLMDALTALRSPLPAPKGESVRDDLVAILEVLRAESIDPRRVRQYALLLGEGERYPRLLGRYIEAVVEPRRQMIGAVLRRGVATGELREGVHVETAIDLLTGAVLAKARRRHDRSERGYARRVVDELLTGMTSR